METGDTDSEQEGRQERNLSNDIDGELKDALESAVGNSDYKQKTVLSAAIDSCVTEVDGEDGIYVVDENLEDELEEWSDRYS